MINRIDEAEQERIGLAAEEMGEALQIIGKILRHGLDSHHPDMPLLSNAHLLELELSHVLAASELLIAAGTLDSRSIFKCKVEKLKKLRGWLHCGANLVAVDRILERDLATIEEQEGGRAEA